MRRVLKTLAVLVLVLLLGAAGFMGYVHTKAPKFEGVASIADEPTWQDAALLKRAWALPAAARHHDGFASQSNGSLCGPATLANTLRSMDDPDDTEAEVLAGTGLCWSGMCFGGLTLDEVADIAREKSGRQVRVIRDISYEEFMEHMKSANDPALRYTINFQRGPLFGKSSGHHSPIGGYLEDEDLVFVLDTNSDYQPWLVSSRRLYEAMDTVDSAADKKRGLLRIEPE